MKEEYKEVVDAGDVDMARMSLSNELLLDPRGGTFNEMLSYAVKHLPDLFVENKEVPYIIPPKDKWDKDFMYDVKIDLDSNFTKEKLAFYEVVVKYVNKDKAIEIEKEESRMSTTPDSVSEKGHPTRTIKITKVSGGVTAGGAIVATAGFCYGITALSIIGGAMFVGGVWLIINDNKR